MVIDRNILLTALAVILPLVIVGLLIYHLGWRRVLQGAGGWFTPFLASFTDDDEDKDEDALLKNLPTDPDLRKVVLAERLERLKAIRERNQKLFGTAVPSKKQKTAGRRMVLLWLLYVFVYPPLIALAGGGFLYFLSILWLLWSLGMIVTLASSLITRFVHFYILPTQLQFAPRLVVWTQVGAMFYAAALMFIRLFYAGSWTPWVFIAYFVSTLAFGFYFAWRHQNEAIWMSLPEDERRARREERQRRRQTAAKKEGGTGGAFLALILAALLIGFMVLLVLQGPAGPKSPAQPKSPAPIEKEGGIRGAGTN